VSSRYVLDSSAVLALIQSEPGANVVRAAMDKAVMSTVNLAETVTKLVERGMPRLDARAALFELKIEYVPFTEAQATLCGELRPATRSRGLSLGDRACLALAIERGLPAMTADAAWLGATSADVVLIR